MQNTIIIFIHLAAAAIAVGASLFSLWLFLPKADDGKDSEHFDENSSNYKVMDVLSPSVFVCLMTLIASGVYFMMENYTDQVNLKEGYYNILGIKLLFVILAFALSVYQTFGLKSKIAHLDLRPEAKKHVPSVLKTMTTLGKAITGLTAFALFMGVYLARY